MQNFVISGKAKEVFRWLELRAYYETRVRINAIKTMPVKQVCPLMGGIEMAVNERGEHTCPYHPSYHCNVDDHAVCAKAKCAPWLKIFTRKYEPDSRD